MLHAQNLIQAPTKKYAEEIIVTIFQEITILQAMATKDKLSLPSYIKY